MQKYTLTIGEMSSLFGLTVQTLRYYDRIGLFRPESRKDNNYREYRFEQCYQLAAICQMRSIGYSVKKIAAIMNSRNTENSTQEMRERIENIRAEQQRLVDTQKTIQQKLQFLEDELEAYRQNPDTSIYSMPQRCCMPIGDEGVLYREKSFYLHPTVVCYDLDGERSFGAYLGDCETITKQQHSREKHLILPAAQYLSAYYHGGYEKVWDFVCELRKKHTSLQLSNYSIHFNIIDQFIEKDPRNYLTRIQIRICNN